MDDSDSKLIVSFLVGGRDAGNAIEFMHDQCAHLAKRVQLTTDGYRAYLEAAEAAFSDEVVYAPLVKTYDAAPEGPKRRYSPAMAAELPTCSGRWTT